MKKFLSLLITIVMLMSLSLTAFAATPSEQSYDVFTYTVMGENGEYVIVEVAEGETVEVPFYQIPESNTDIMPMSLVQTATLVIGRSGNSVFFKFVPELLYILTTIGFNGSFSVTNYSGMSQGTYYYIIPVLSDYVPGSTNCNVVLSGTYAVLGFENASIFQGAYGL